MSAGGAGHLAEEQPETTGTALFRGGMIGRYIVLGLLGKGGMGVVYSAYDPELDRKVALKLLRVIQGRKGTDLDAKRQRLLREAKAIARLSHPSVVVVYDVGTYQDQVFIAMELVDGMTATRWRDTAKPTWKQVLEVFKAAGEGLAAAHAADLIHRDLKPDNVMVTRDDKVRVMDFGLARQMERASEESFTSIAASPEGEEPTMPGSRPFEARLTNEGNVVGTHAYMPPEQYLGITDERSDQFSFCVSLYECIYGTHPFDAKTSHGLTANVQAGRVHDAPAGTKVPVWLRKILLKGMKPRPEDRYQSMRELLEALARDPAIARRRWLVAGGVAVSAVALAIGVQRAADSKRAFCAAAPEKLASAWELPAGPRHSAVTKAFLATRKGYAPDAVRGVTRSLDDYASRWAGLYKDTCEATHVRGEQSSEVLDLRMACLTDRLNGLRALTDVFMTANVEVVEHAVEASHALTPLDGCNDVKQLRSIIPPPDPAVKAQVEQLREGMGRVKATHDAGKYAAALEMLKPIVDKAQSLKYRPIEAEALYRIGTATVELSNFAEAERVLEAALQAAVASHHDDLLPEISALLVWSVGFQGRYTEADRWRRFAESTIERSGGENTLAYSWLLNDIGVVYHLQRRLNESLEYQQRAQVIKERLLGEGDPDVASSLGNEALTLNTLERPQEALALNQRAIRILEQTLGALHPRVANQLSNRGEILVKIGAFDEALRAYERAQRIWEHAVGPDDPAVAYALTGAGRSLVALGRPDEALPPLRKALQIRAQRDGENARLGETTFALATAEWEGNRNAPLAVSLARKALALYSQSPASGVAAASVKAWLAKHAAAATVASRSLVTGR